MSKPTREEMAGAIECARSGLIVERVADKPVDASAVIVALADERDRKIEEGKTLVMELFKVRKNRDELLDVLRAHETWLSPRGLAVLAKYAKVTP